MKKKKDNDTKQGDKFIAAAKEHGCDEDEKEFSEKVKKIASGKPPKK